MKYDIDALQSQVKTNIESCATTLESAKQAATGLSAPSDFKYTAKLTALPNEISSIIETIRSAGAWVDKKIVAIVNAELSNLRVLQGMGFLPGADFAYLFSMLASGGISIPGGYQTSSLPTLSGSREEIEAQFRERYGTVPWAVILSSAKDEWEYVCKNVKSYGGGVNIPLTSNEMIDCSSFVSQVLYKYGVETGNQALVSEFRGTQHNTETLKTVDWEKMRI